MLTFLAFLLGFVTYGVHGLPVSGCQDLDTQACVLFEKAKPDLCTDPNFADVHCKRFCGKCPLECYSCPTPVLNPRDCNTTISCGANETCMTKHLRALDGHDEYIMICEKKMICDGFNLGFGAFGKRAVTFYEESEEDIEVHDRYQRDVSISCCDTDFCNFPFSTTTTTTTTTTTVSPTSAGPFPHGCNRDIVFVLDDSGSVGNTNFRHALDFIRNIVQELEIGPTKAQIGLLVFSTHPQVGWYLNHYQTKSEVTNAISKVSYYGGTTHTYEALQKVRTDFFNTSNGDRPANENVVLVLTDGQSNNHQNTILEADKLHMVSKDVISVVIGSGIDVNELNAIATDMHHVFDLRSYSVLGTILQQLMQIICNA